MEHLVISTTVTETRLDSKAMNFNSEKCPNPVKKHHIKVHRMERLRRKIRLERQIKNQYKLLKGLWDEVDEKESFVVEMK